MVCCQNRIARKKKVAHPVKNIVAGYSEGQDGFVTLRYLQNELRRIKGCQSRHIFLFSDSREYKVDANDAMCLLDVYPNLFEEVIDFVEGDTGEIEGESSEIASTGD